MSIFTDMHLDPDKTGVTLEELEHRSKLRKIRESFREEKNGGWTVERYYSHEGGEIVEYKKYRKLGSWKMTIQIMGDYTWITK